MVSVDMADGLASGFVGRTAEINVLRGMLEGLGKGKGGLALVQGEAGIGKSRLVEEFADIAKATEAAISTGTVDEFDVHRPFAGWQTVLGLAPDASDPLAAEIGSVLAGDGPAIWSPYRTSSAIIDLVEYRCSETPLVLILDNLHWVDDDTVETLSRLQVRAASLPLMLIGTARTGGWSSALDRLVTQAEQIEPELLIDVPPLNEGEIEQMAVQLIGGRPGPFLRRQLERTAGNPLLIAELAGMVRNAIGDSDIEDERKDEHQDEREVDVAPDFDHKPMLSPAAAFVPPDLVDVLSVASVLGATFAVEDLSALLGRSSAELVGPLDESIRSGTLRTVDQHYQFRHDLVRDALYAGLDEPIRVALHREAAIQLRGRGVALERVAEHVLRSATTDDDATIELLDRSAINARPRSPLVAIELWQRSLALLSDDDPRRAAVTDQLLEAQLRVGAHVDVEEQSRSLLQQTHPPERRRRLRRYLVQSLILRGRPADALAEADAALDEYGYSLAEEAELRSARAFAQLSLGHLALAKETAAQAVSEARAAGDNSVLRDALVSAAQVDSAGGHVVSGADYALEAVQIVDKMDDPEANARMAHAAAGSFLVTVDRVDEGLRVMNHGRMTAEQVGAKGSLALCHVSLGYSLTVIGDWDEAIVEFESSRALDNGQNIAWPILSHGALGLIAFERNQIAEAQRHMNEADAALAAGHAPARIEHVMLVKALLMEADGRAADGLATLTQAWTMMTSAGLGMSSPVIGPAMVRRLVNLPNGAGMDDARTAADFVGTFAEANRGAASFSGAALISDALVTGDADRAVEAVESYRRGHRKLETALACEDAARLLGTARRAEAVEMLEVAASLYDDLDAERGTLRVVDVLGQYRGGARRARPARPTHGVAALTNTERTVADLVAKRLSNPEIAEQLYISRRTVETHVSRILAKLGVRSRRDVAKQLDNPPAGGAGQ